MADERRSSLAPEGIPPGELVDRLRELQEQIPDFAPLTDAQRLSLMKVRAAISEAALQSSINLIGAWDGAEAAIGQTYEEVRQYVDYTARWSTVEGQLKAMLRGVSDANLVRWARADQIATQAYLICQQLAKDPAYARLRPRVAEILRLRKLRRRKRPQPAAQAADSEPNSGNEGEDGGGTKSE
jgi:hypothetical protein